ncbi:MAG: hypothetical protein A2076_08375 [Geobacteraceae bacterium GWC2_53_11]|nr:MAG: hypothetical protein A2076_08375 [Geobacteraceae bacterium GWC2_53_11]
MDFKFGKSSGDSQPEEAPGETKKQSALVVLLLILVGGFTYIYFFTGLVKPQEAKKVEEAPAASAPQVAKMPLPARENEPAAPTGKAPAKAEAPKTAAAPAVKPAAAPAKAAPAPAPVAKAAPAPAPAPAKPKEAPKKAEAAKPVDKKPAAVAGAEKKGAEKKAVVEAKKSATPEKKSAPAKEAAKKPAADAKAKPEAVAASKHAAPASWSIMVGNYVLEEALSADMGRVRKAGFNPLVKPSVRKKNAMHRLLVAEVTDRATAQATLEKLKRHTSDAFVIEQGGKFAVYAGSYLQNEAASTEKERLKSSGFPVTVKNADIAIPSQSLSVGPFKNKKAADAALGKLRSAGIKATLLSK